MGTTTMMVKGRVVVVVVWLVTVGVGKLVLTTRTMMGGTLTAMAV